MMLTGWFAVVSAFALPIQDPLFSKMNGVWAGSGERVSLLSGKRTELRTRVVGAWDGEKFVSENFFEEIAHGAVQRSYRKVYWMTPVPGVEGAYRAGNGDEGNGPLGHFDGSRFVLEQRLGGRYRVVSTTEFGDGTSTYREVFLEGDLPLSETVIRYEKSD